MAAKLTHTSFKVEQPKQYLFPVSFAQQRLWFLDQLEGASAVYNVKLPVRLHGPLNLDCLQQAVDILVARHETLRTSFSTQLGVPRQVISSSATVRVRPVKMQGADGEQIRAKVAELAGEPFELDKGPLIRVHLLQLGIDENLLLLLTHHIVSDAWSSSVMFGDLASAYDALTFSQTPSLPELTVQYADYAVWQRDWLAGPALTEQVDYWKKKLAGAPALLQLPTDRPRPQRQTYNGSRVSRTLSAKLTAALNQLARSESCTLFMVILAALNILLARYVGHDDVLVGSPIAGRRRTELEALIGLFVNTLVFRADVNKNASYRELLAQIRATALEAYAHQDLPFEKLVEVLQPPRDRSHSPIFQVMFIHQNAPWEAQPIRSLQVSPGEIGAGATAKFDLTVSTTEFDGVLYLNFEYNTDLFDCSTIERFSAGFETLLEAIVLDPNKSVHAYPLHSCEEQRRVLSEWNRTDADFAKHETVHGLFEQQVQRTPTAVALESQSLSWCYADLDARADALAAEIRQRESSGPFPVIAVCLERSLAMVSAILGALKTGAAYLPIDPTYPADRLNFMLQDSGAEILVTESENMDRFPAFMGAIVGIDEEGWVTRTRPALVDDVDRSIYDAFCVEPLAYLIYTSGSTGQPKGVCIPHRAVVNFLTSMAESPGMKRADRMLAVTTMCFDISVLELFLPLTVGGTTIIAAGDVANDCAALSDLIDRAEITVMQATPATWRLLLNGGWRGREGLKILCGGEPLDRDLADQLLASGSSLWNMYGPTETTIWSTCKRVVDSGLISIGRPIANTRTYILDMHMQPVPVGVVGDLYIGGDGLAVGYHRREALTAESFITSSLDRSGRMYRTGDQARYRVDGTIELLGRADQQIKLRGFRIELGEIEAVLSEHPGVAACTVALCKRSSVERSLVGYVVSGATPVDANTLRDYLKRRLPDYMVPVLFIPLAELPLTPNGKLDRRNLPSPDWKSESLTPTVVPRTPVETTLCSVFKNVLSVGMIGIGDNFFDLGGHSLLATQLISRIRDALDVDLPLRVLFDSPTVEGLAAYLDTEEIPARILALKPRDTRAHNVAPASFMQQRLWFLDQLEPCNPVYNLVWATRLYGQLDVVALEQAVSAIACRHEILRTTFIEQDGTPLQLIADESVTSVVLESSVEALGENLDRRIIELAQRPFDLHAGPLLRVNVLRVSERESALLLVVHHIISDGWSMSVLFRELATAYNAFRRKALPDWPRLPVQYADYAVWQREWLAGEELDRQLCYWREQLTAAPLVLDLPGDRPRPLVQSSNGARVGRQIPGSLTAQLHELSRTEGATLFMVLLAAFDVVLGQYAGQQDVLVGTPIAGRNRTELEGLIGFFVNTLVLRTDLSGNPGFRELLARVKNSALGAYAHQDLPFERLVDELNPERDRSRTPIFQVMFNLHNEPGQSLGFDELQATPISVDRGTAKFDLTVSLTESDRGLFVSYEYNADIFDKETIEGLSVYYESVLSSVVASPGQRISALAGLAEPGCGGAVGDEAGAAASAAPQVGTLGEAFVEQVVADAKRLAVQTAGHRWSYGVLNERANQVAHGLLAVLPAPSDGFSPRVGLMCAQDAPVVAGILGILKAGGAYVALDPGHPVARLQAVIADAGIEVVVADAAHADAAGQLSAGAVINIEALAGMPVSEPGVAIDAQSLAYILYTSGTTGRPKGVMQTHAGVLQQIGRYSDSLKLVADDRLSLLSGYGFDAAVQDIFGALLNGAALYPLAMRELMHAGVSSSELMDELTAAQVTVLHATPTVYRYLLGGELSCTNDLSCIRRVVLGGEMVRRADFEIFKARFARGTQFVNGLGLTESTLALQYFADHDTRLLGQVVPVGEAVAGIGLELLDQSGEASWYGEITLTGEGISPGYWRSEALNAAHFERVGSDTVYRTGDIGRRLPDGQIAYVGRRDEQVKIRGYRVELGEIESLLVGHTQVTACVATLAERAGATRLVAYVVAEAGQVPVIDELRTYLAAHLPAYMLPQSYEVLSGLPTLANGKVDRGQLPEPRWGRDPQQLQVPPRTELEAVLTGIWLDVLQLQEVGVHDDFFALGGHSLLATRLISRVRDQLKLEVPLRIIFENPGIRSMAAAIETIKQNDSLPSIVTISREARQIGDASGELDQG